MTRGDRQAGRVRREEGFGRGSAAGQRRGGRACDRDSRAGGRLRGFARKCPPRDGSRDRCRRNCQNSSMAAWGMGPGWRVTTSPSRRMRGGSSCDDEDVGGGIGERVPDELGEGVVDFKALHGTPASLAASAAGRRENVIRPAFRRAAGMAQREGFAVAWRFLGTVMRNLVSRPGTEVTLIEPPWASMARLTMERPRPVPLISRCEWCFSTR